MNEEIFRKNLKTTHLLLPISIVAITFGLLYLFVNHDFVGFFYYGYPVTGILIWSVFSFFFFSWITAFFILMFSDPGSMQTELKYFKGKHNCTEICKICGIVKPYRTHHCRRCGYCFARMDHHCASMGFCIALRNTKIFIPFLVYSVIMLTIYAVSSFLMIVIGNHASFPYVLVFDIFAGGTLAVILGLLVSGHILGILSGRTLLEERFDIVVETEKTGYERFQEVFGPPSIRWILPIPLGFDEVSPFIWEKYRKSDESKKDK